MGQPERSPLMLFQVGGHGTGLAEHSCLPECPASVTYLALIASKSVAISLGSACSQFWGRVAARFSAKPASCLVKI